VNAATEWAAPCFHPFGTTIMQLHSGQVLWLDVRQLIEQFHIEQSTEIAIASLT